MRNYCHQFEDVVSEYIDDILTPEEQQRWLKHLETCERCQKTLAKTKLLVQSLESIEPPQLSDKFHEQLQLKMKRATLRKKVGVPFFPSLSPQVLSVTALIMVVMISGVLFYRTKELDFFYNGKGKSDTMFSRESEKGNSILEKPAPEYRLNPEETADIAERGGFEESLKNEKSIAFGTIAEQENDRTGGRAVGKTHQEIVPDSDGAELNNSGNVHSEENELLSSTETYKRQKPKKSMPEVTVEKEIPQTSKHYRGDTLADTEKESVVDNFSAGDTVSLRKDKKTNDTLQEYSNEKRGLSEELNEIAGPEPPPSSLKSGMSLALEDQSKGNEKKRSNSPDDIILTITLTDSQNEPLTTLTISCSKTFWQEILKRNSLNKQDVVLQGLLSDKGVVEVTLPEIHPDKAKLVALLNEIKKQTIVCGNCPADSYPIAVELTLSENQQE